MDNEEMMKQIRDFFEKEALRKNDAVSQFSDNVINLAYQKLSAGIEDILQNEEDPMVIAELLKSFLETTDMIEKKGLQKQQVLIKLFEQLNKYEQSRYY